MTEMSEFRQVMLGFTLLVHISLGARQSPSYAKVSFIISYLGQEQNFQTWLVMIDA